MKIGLFFAIACAIVLHAGFLLFGGVLFADPEKDEGTLREVELLSDDVTAEKDKIEEKIEEPEEIETETEEAPDAAEIIRNLETPPMNDAPALDAASLSALEQALSGQTGDGDFTSVLSLGSGGVIGGTGKGGALGDDRLQGAFSLAEIDQKPRATFQTSPVYPSEMRSKKLEGVVTIIFIVDSAGKVANPRVEKSNHPAFEKPALDAVKKWKFEPGVKGGQRVATKARQTIRFPVSQ